MTDGSLPQGYAVPTVTPDEMCAEPWERLAVPCRRDIDAVFFTEGTSGSARPVRFSAGRMAEKLQEQWPFGCAPTGV